MAHGHKCGITYRGQTVVVKFTLGYDTDCSVKTDCKYRTHTVAICQEEKSAAGRLPGNGIDRILWKDIAW